MIKHTLREQAFAHSGRGPFPILAFALLLALVMAPGDAGAQLREGDFGVEVDGFSHPGDGEDTLYRLYIRIPSDQILWRERGDSLVARLELEWEMLAFGEIRAEGSQELSYSRREGSEEDGAWLSTHERLLPPGSYRIEVRCRDLGGKIGGIGGFMGHHPEARFSSLVSVRDFRSGGTLGDLLFFTYLGEDSVTRPNPAGAFYEGASWLEVKTLFVPPHPLPAESDRYFGLTLQILGSDGEARFDRRGGWKYDAKELPLHFRIPLGELPADNYRLVLDIEGEGLPRTSLSRALSVLPRGGAALAIVEQKQIEAQLFLSGENYQAWLRLPEPEQLSVMAHFWKQQDPNPNTLENEVYDEFQRRFAIAQERYTIFRSGALSERGRVLIRYGEPDELVMDVLPKNRQSLIDAVRDLHGKEAVEPGVSPWEDDVTKPGETLDQDLKRDLAKIGMGNSLAFGNESEPFEVWKYRMGGKPLLAQYRLNLRDVGLKLIFSDRLGYGDYELVFRSEEFEF